MLQTIAEADLYGTNDVFRGVVEEIIEDSPVLGFMPFAEVVGNALQYLRENVLTEGTFFDPGEEWVEATPEVTQVTAVLKIIGGDADVDNFLQRTRRSHNDIRASLLSMKAKGIARTFQDRVIYGDATTNPKEFDGLHELMPSGQKVAAGSSGTPGVGTFSKLDELIDKVRPRPDLLMMSRRSLRGIRKLARSQGWDLALSDPGRAGINRKILFYSDIPVVINDFQVDTESITTGTYSAKTGGTASSIFAIRFAEDGFHGIRNGPFPDIVDIGDLEDKDATRTRIRGYVATVLKSTKSIGVLDGISSGDWTN